MTDKNGISAEKAGAEHRITVTNREMTVITGAEEVLSFDETGAVIRTTLGVLAVDGENIRVTKLDTAGGNVEIDGKINGMFWTDGRDKRGRTKRLPR